MAMILFFFCQQEAHHHDQRSRVSQGDNLRTIPIYHLRIGFHEFAHHIVMRSLTL